ncbi:NAD(P)/FAD-dependent oxidoreductase [Primorskyibacter sp. S187A]|uniref:NAD(P)/FAD-dependent oxidoreductase n=1 Tax=Primorskyibacter sp. S187A TaxID=3415130 RepID=UPI003C7E3F13
MDLLTANDTPGQHARSWYAATALDIGSFPALQSDVRADVCVIGAGFTGLSCALHLAEAGRRVVVLEASRVGSGASGRNGGQLGSGQRLDQVQLEKMLGREDAATYWHLGEEAKACVRGIIARHGIACYLRPGIASAGSTPGEVQDLHDYVAFLQDRYGYTEIEALSEDAFAALCPSPDYRGGAIDRGAGHLHPLRFAQGMGAAAVQHGAEVYENTRVTALTPGHVQTARGSVRADHIVLACNGYLGTLAPQVAARVMPINNFVAATEPLGSRQADVLTQDAAVADERFVVNYFRLSHDGRLLFGGGESYGYRFPKDIAAKVRKPMLQIFPHLKDVKIDYAWGGTLAITMKRLPYLTQLAPGVLSASGYSGHGVGTATHAGALMAQAIQGESDGFDTMAALPSAPFPGGPRMRTPLLALAMTWYALRDRLGC